MRKWTRDRMKRREKGDRSQSENAGQGPAPLQPTFLDREGASPGTTSPHVHASESSENRAPHEAFSAPATNRPPFEEHASAPPEPLERDAQLEAGPSESAAPERPEQKQPRQDQRPDQRGTQGPRRDRSRRRGRGGRSRQQDAARSAAAADQPRRVLPFAPGQATGEASEIGLGAEPPHAEAEAAHRPAHEKGKPRGAVVLAIGLPGSGKSSWFKRHNIIPLSSDLVRGLLFDNPTEQRYQDLVFSSLRSLLRARMISGRPMSYIDATNLSPKERHSWIKMARDFGYEAHAVFFDVPAEVCMDRNRKRSRNVPDDVMLRMSQKLKPPTFEEGFAKIIVVRLKSAASAAEKSAKKSGDSPEQVQEQTPERGSDQASESLPE